MRCEQCNKFAAYDDSNDPEVESLDISDGRISGEVRIFLAHDECGTELKEGRFDLDLDVRDEDGWPEGDDWEIAEEEVEEGSVEMTSRQQTGEEVTPTRGPNKGKTVFKQWKPRYWRTFYGFRLEVMYKLKLKDARTSEEMDLEGTATFEDEVPASGMEELC